MCLSACSGRTCRWHAASVSIACAYTNRIAELEARRAGGGGYVQLGPANGCDPEDGKKSASGGKVAGKRGTKDEGACSKLRNCCLA